MSKIFDINHQSTNKFTIFSPNQSISIHSLDTKYHIFSFNIQGQLIFTHRYGTSSGNLITLDQQAGHFSGGNMIFSVQSLLSFNDHTI
jgi:hypothetical protein